MSTLLALDRSYLAVQGPPGTGKTYLGSLVIKRLVEEHGWRIGVVGQSHAVVENLLVAVVGKGLSPAVVAKRDKRNKAATWVGLSPASLATWKAEQTAGYVVGGTVWGFVGNAVEPEGLDLLVVDEAGQFCLANTLAVSTAAQRLLLLGDPQQLPQVSQGCHGEPVDDSALSWVIGASATLPE
ncbi:AAA family ATPase, partial [Streptomyces rhizosphaericus]|uniref:AAA family ATPase n=1 Tax=Streptomyces rhizosphaericus TaxID=114699 RepID=UPI0031D5AEFB